MSPAGELTGQRLVQLNFNNEATTEVNIGLPPLYSVLGECQMRHAQNAQLGEEYTPVYFPGDDLFAIERPRGLPIGNLTSQYRRR